MTNPLTGGNTPDTKMVLSLLKYANREQVAQALTARGYSVKRVTVNRWAAGAEMPSIAARMILELFGHRPDTTKDPQPEWAGEMEERLRLELKLNRALIEGDPDEIRRMRAEVQEYYATRPPDPPPDSGPRTGAPHPPGRAGGSAP